MQKLFFPICFLIFSVACINHWYNNRGVWTFEQAEVVAVAQASEVIETSPVTSENVADYTLDGKPGQESASVTVAAESKGDTNTHLPVSVAAIETKIREVFHEEPEVATAIFKAESGLNPTKESDSDRMADGRPFSAGLAQINLTVSGIDGVDCTKAFSGRNYKAKVIDESLYKKCLNLAKNPEKALLAARAKYDNNGFRHWSVFLSGVYKRHM